MKDEQGVCERADHDAENGHREGDIHMFTERSDVGMGKAFERGAQRKECTYQTEHRPGSYQDLQSTQLSMDHHFRVSDENLDIVRTFTAVSNPSMEGESSLVRPRLGRDHPLANSIDVLTPRCASHPTVEGLPKGQAGLEDKP
ncbi:hypothetical protein VN12_12565 [Pirellula sp. SH-Sr6A]|nr:hypothetical protein VN12_12565 [Pirellula sp. SH-Sr6A]